MSIRCSVSCQGIIAGKDLFGLKCFFAVDQTENDVLVFGLIDARKLYLFGFTLHFSFCFVMRAECIMFRGFCKFYQNV